MTNQRDPRAPMRSVVAEPRVGNLPLALSILLTGTFIGTVSNNIVNVPLPAIIDEFDAPLSSGVLVVTGFLIALAATMPLAGWAGDRFGRRRIFCVALIGTTICSVGAATSTSLEVLIAWRVLAGVMVSAFGPVVLGLIAWLTGPDRRMKAISAWATVNGSAQAVGPALGGFLTEAWGWRWVFLPMAPIAAIALLGTLIFIPRHSGRRIAFDVIGATTITFGSAALVLAVSVVAIPAVPGLAIAGLLLLGSVIIAVFVWHSLRTREPFIDVRAVATTRFARSAVAAVAQMFCLGATLLAVPLRLHDWGYATGTVGAVVLVLPTAMALTAPVIGALGDRVGPRRVLRLGLVMLATSQFALAIVLAGSAASLPLTMSMLVLTGLSMGFIQTTAATGSTRTAVGATGSGLGLFSLLRFAASAAGAGWVSAGLFLSNSFATVIGCAGLIAATALIATFLGRNPETSESPSLT